MSQARKRMKAHQNKIKNKDKSILQITQFNRNLLLQHLPKKTQKFLPQSHLHNIMVLYILELIYLSIPRNFQTENKDPLILQ